MSILLEKINRLEEVFHSRESEVRAFLPEPGRFERLRKDAATLEARFPTAASRPPLYGVFFGVKDIYHVDGFPTHAGSRLPADVITGPQGDAVRRLLNAGALLVGKTVTTEFAYFAPGPTRNPHNPSHTPGGSSSGSAAAVAAELCEIALGTQTIGSVNRPAAFCGVFGFKPSYDRIPRTGIIPLSNSLDHAGLFAANLSLLENSARQAVTDWRVVNNAPSPAFAVPNGSYLANADPVGRRHFDSVTAFLAQQGLELREIDLFDDDFNAIRERHQLILAAEAARVHAAWFEAYVDLYHPKTAELIKAGREISDDRLQMAVEQLSAYRERLMEAMHRLHVDIFLTPSAPGPAPKGLESTGDPVMNLPWTQAGLPTITLPAGFSESGLPLGVQLVGKWQEDEQLFSAAAMVLDALLTYNSSKRATS